MGNIHHESVGSNTPNTQYTELFLSRLAPGAERFTFQSLTDDAVKRKHYKSNGGRDPLARIVHGSLATRGHMLVQLSAAGAGIYVVVNETDFNGRATANIVRVRAYFVDLDG